MKDKYMTDYKLVFKLPNYTTKCDGNRINLTTFEPVQPPLLQWNGMRGKDFIRKL